MDVNQLNALVRFYQQKLAEAVLESGQLVVRNSELENENAMLRQAAEEQPSAEDTPPQPEQE